MIRFVAVLGFALVATQTLAATNLSSFAGTRSGESHIPVGDGKTEKFKCTSTISPDGTSMTLRCANASVPAPVINTRIKLTQTGEDIKGTWEERAFGLIGDIEGKLGSNSLQARFIGGGAEGTVLLQLIGSTLSVTVNVKGQKTHKISLSK